jgi:hypothetical protein
VPLNNPIPFEPKLSDLLNQVKKQVMLELNCCHLGTIQSFDGEKKTCTVTINYQKTFIERQENGTYEPKPRPYPILSDVPVFVLSGGSGKLSMPINKGDQCLIIFNDRDIDRWYDGQTNSELATSRLHSLSDGIALVGVFNKTVLDSSYDSTRVILKHGQAEVGISETKIRVKNDLTTLNTLLASLIDALNLLIIDVSGSTGTVNAASVTALNAIKTNIATLLE